MASRRKLITMDPAEVVAFIAEEKVANVATMSPNGRPHLAPVWYVPDGDGLVTWTYGTSQKARNLERSALATVGIEAGGTYETLRGVSLECDVELLTDTERVAGIGLGIMARYSGTEPDAATREFVAAQAPKRVGLICRPTRTISWDHRKLGGGY